MSVAFVGSVLDIFIQDILKTKNFSLSLLNNAKIQAKHFLFITNGFKLFWLPDSLQCVLQFSRNAE